MTSNQISYQKNIETERANRVAERLKSEEIQLSKQQLRETKRSNLAREVELERSNLAKERETTRSNQAKESLQALNNMITGSHFYRSDLETQRSNQARETETQRSNLAAESHKQSQLEQDLMKHTTDKVAAANKYAGAAYAIGSSDPSFSLSQLGRSIVSMLGISPTNYISYHNNNVNNDVDYAALPRYGSE